MNWTEQQREAVEAVKQHVCVDAGAGSGKTKVLVDHIVLLIQDGHAKLEDIVAITFTDKAAAEMKERLRKAFHDLGNAAEQKSSEEQTRWRGLERRVETSRISTIHSFCMAILKENALALGMDPDFGILTDADRHFLVNEVIEESLHGLLDQEDVPAMRLATEFGVGRLSKMLRILLAKRPVMERIRTGNHYDSPEALLRYWEECRAEDLRRRCEEARADEALVKAHAMTMILLDQCPDTTDKLRQTVAIASEALSSLMAQSEPDAVMDALGTLAGVKKTGGSKKKWNPPESLDDAKAFLDEVREVARGYLPDEVDPADDALSAQLTCDLVAVYGSAATAMGEAKTARTVCDFDDLILDALHILGEDEEVRGRTARGIKHLLIDEFQDTDRRQLDLACVLCGQPGGPTLFIVGDAKQSIYRFRGAEVDVFDVARKRHTEHTVALGRNFRSIPDVLEFINDFFRHSNLLRRVEPEYRGLKPHREIVDDCRVEFLIPEPVEGAKTADYREAEARLIARRIRGLNESGVPYGDVAMLFRSLRDAYVYEKALRDHGVPYALTAGTGFYERQEITDLRNLLTVVVEPWDEMALLGLLRGPLVGMSDDALARLCAHGRLADLFHADTAIADMLERQHFEQARALVDECRRHSEMPLVAFIRYVLDRTKYEAVALSQPLGVQKASNVRKLVDLAEGFARSQSPRLSAFVRYLDEVAGEQIREGEVSLQGEGSDAVSLMTIHKSKGLEFPVVIVPDMSRGKPNAGDLQHELDPKYGLALKVTGGNGELKPSTQGGLIARRVKELEDAESARVLYVALTRARDRLLMCGSPEPKKDSWLALLNDQYQIVDREDGATFAGEAWRATVRRRLDGMPASPSPDSGETAQALEALLARAEAVPEPRPTRRTIAVTTLLNLMTDGGEADERDAAERTRSTALQRGSLVHAVLEQWDFRAPVEHVVDALIRQEGCTAAGSENLPEDLARIARRVQESPLGARLAEATGVQREAPFVLCLGGAVVTGVIDALLPDGTIVDYKTGKHRDDKHAGYETQLRLYAAAVRQVLAIDPPEALLCYVDSENDAGLLRRVDISAARVDETVRSAQETIEAYCQGETVARTMATPTR
jgi:ATP-dependent helicase/nuclease subunit A